MKLFSEVSTATSRIFSGKVEIFDKSNSFTIQIAYSGFSLHFILRETSLTAFHYFS